MRIAVVGLIMIGAIVVPISCGSGGSGPGTFTTGVPGNTKLTSLTASQAAQLCSDVSKYVESTLTASLCGSATRVAGIEAAYALLAQNPSSTNTELQTACTQGAAADAGTFCGTGADSDSGSCNITSEPATCLATVADATKCINDDTAALMNYYNTLPSCASLTAATLTAFFSSDGGNVQRVPTSCSMFNSTCSQMTTAATSGP